MRPTLIQTRIIINRTVSRLKTRCFPSSVQDIVQLDQQVDKADMTWTILAACLMVGTDVLSTFDGTEMLGPEAEDITTSIKLGSVPQIQETCKTAV